MRRQLEKFFVLLGKPGIAGVGILAFCAMFYWSAIHAQVQAVRTLRNEVRVLEASRASAMRQVDLTARDPGKQLSMLIQALPPDGSLGELTGQMFATAKKYNVVLKTGSYQTVWEKTGRIGRYQMTFQTEAPYYLTRFFLRDILNEIPVLSLNDISVQRKEVSAPKPEITLKFTLLFARG